MVEAGTDIELRPPTPADIPAIDELYRIVKGRARPQEVTRHRFFDTPWGDSPAIIALDGDRCVAAGVVWPAALRVGGEVVLAGQGTDAATHPDYRSRPRLFLRLAREVKAIVRSKAYYVYYTFPNPRSIKLTKHVGATYLGTVGAWGVELQEGRRWLRRRPKLVPGVTFERQESPDVLALIKEAHREKDVIRVEKSREWLDWRYSEVTAERYEWGLFHDGDGRLSAAALIGERDPELWGPDFAGLLRVHELFALDAASCQRLLRGVLAHVSRAGARKLDVLVKDSMLESAVAQAGFAHESERPITTIVFRPELPLDVHDFAHWRLISGDMDFF